MVHLDTRSPIAGISKLSLSLLPLLPLLRILSFDCGNAFVLENEFSRMPYLAQGTGVREQIHDSFYEALHLKKVICSCD